MTSRSRIIAFALRRATVWKTTWRLRLLLAGLVLIVAAASGRFLLTTAGAILIQQDPLQPADAILVDVTVNPSLSSMRQAARLEQGGYASTVLLTRYLPTDRLERAGLPVPRDFDAVIRIYAADAGLRLEHVEMIPIDVVDPVTMNTARQVAAYCHARGIRSLIMVDAPFHSRRSALAYAHFLTPLGIRLMSQPVESGLQASNWWHIKDGWLSVIQETVALMYYRVFVL